MTIYVFDGTIDGLLTAVFDAFALHEQPEQLLKAGDALPLFCDRTYHVNTDDEKARRVWTGLEKRLPREAMKLIYVSWLSELPELSTPCSGMSARCSVRVMSHGISPTTMCSR